jgi:glycosyltransferase involved in cell wall biosynthesis
MPTVSVVIAAYNAVKYLDMAIDSVLAQSFRDLEVIVVDDGSTDATEVMMSKYGPPVRYLRQANAGVSIARNRGLETSTGRYVAFLDADDTWLPGKVERQVAALTGERRSRACYSAYIVCSEALEPITVKRSRRHGSSLEDLLLAGNVIGSICTVMCERSLFDAVGGFDPALSQCADWDMWVRLATATEFLYVDEPLVTYRQHGASMSRDAPLLERDSVRVLEKGFALEGLSPSLRAKRRRAFGRNYAVLAGTYFHAHRYGDFIRCAARAASLDWAQVGYLAAFPVRAMRRYLHGGRAAGQWGR